MCFIVIVRHTSVLLTFHCATDQKCRLAVLIHVLTFYLYVYVLDPYLEIRQYRFGQLRFYVSLHSFLNDIVIIH